MSWLFSQALVAEYSEASSLDGAPCALWSGTPTPQACSWLGKTTDACRLSLSGMMFKPLTADHGEAVLMSYLEAFPAKIFPQPEKAQGLMGNAAECGPTWPASLAKFDPASSSWRTHQCLLFEDSTECLETFPRWGSMCDGELWEHTMSEQDIKGRDYGLLGTPLARMWKNRYWWNRKDCMGNLDELPAMNPEMYGHLAGKQMSLTWLEHHMIFPLGWTELKPLETHKFQQWQRSHGEF